MNLRPPRKEERTAAAKPRSNVRGTPYSSHDGRKLDSSSPATRTLPPVCNSSTARSARHGGDGDGTLPPTSGRAGIVNGLLGLGELIQGSFGACFSGNYAPPEERGGEGEGGEEGARSRLGKAGERLRRDTEFALKMALTYRGQDPAQVQ